MIAAARVEGGAHTFAHEYLAETLRSLLPLMERLGITTAEELDVDTLAERLRSEAIANSACMMLPRSSVRGRAHLPEAPPFFGCTIRKERR